MKFDGRTRLAIRLLRALTRLCGLSVKEFDAEVARVQSMTADELDVHALATKHALAHKLVERGKG